MASIFDITGSAMNAQMLRLNTTASNLANADAVSGTEAGAYRARQPVFSALLAPLNGDPLADATVGGVQVERITESTQAIPRRYEPANPLADATGHVYGANVNPIEEMANMISASRSYQSATEVFNTTKTLMLRTLQLGS